MVRWCLKCYRESIGVNSKVYIVGKGSKQTMSEAECQPSVEESLSFYYVDKLFGLWFFIYINDSIVAIHFFYKADSN